MDGGGRATGFAIPVVLLLWITGVAFAFGNLNEDDAGVAASATPEPSPVSLPTVVQVGTDLDPDTGQVNERTARFGAGSTIAFSVWLGTPYGGDTVLVDIARLEPDGFRVVGETEELPADADSPILAGQIPAQLLIDNLGPGTYLLDLKRTPTERIGYGVVQLETEIPEVIDLFHDGWRDVEIRAGEHTGYRFGPDGAIVAEAPSSLDRDAVVSSNHRATFGGRTYIFVLDAPWENHYLEESDAVRLAPASPTPDSP
jgi:hypothetical protein